MLVILLVKTGVVLFFCQPLAKHLTLITTHQCFPFLWMLLGVFFNSLLLTVEDQCGSRSRPVVPVLQIEGISENVLQQLFYLPLASNTIYFFFHHPHHHYP